MLSPARRLLKLFHPEAIPWPFCHVYDAVSATEIFGRQYDLVARDIARLCTGGRVLDIGTGPARLLLTLHRQAPRLVLTGMDASAPMVAAARRHVAAAGLSGVIQVTAGNASDLPFPNGAFDLVVSTGSIHHWKDPVRALGEVHRVLRDGGRALMYDLVSDMPRPVLEETAREFGWLRILLLWLHGFEEPFYARAAFASLADPTPFGPGETRFVGVLCCLALQKRGAAS